MHHRRPAPQAGREPARPDQPQRRSVPEHPRPGQGGRPEGDAIVLVVSQPGRRADLPRRSTQLGLPASAGDRPGHAARHGPVPQPDRRGARSCPPTQVKATDPRRARRQHGARSGRARTAGGLPLEQFPGSTSAVGRGALRRTRGSGAEVIKLKGGAGFAVGLSIREVVHAVALDQKRILPVTTLVRGRTASATSASRCRRSSAAAGSRPSSRSSSGPRSGSALQHSGQVLRETIDQVLKTQPERREGASPRPRPSSPAPASVQRRAVAGHDGVGWQRQPLRRKSSRHDLGTGGRGPSWRSRSTASWPASTPTRTAARTSSSPTPRTPTWPSASARRAARPRRTPARSATARWRSTATRSRRSSSRGSSTSC